MIKLPSCHSTNAVASDLLAGNNLDQGAVIITDKQTAGKGQRGNTWESAPGQNLTFSVVVSPVFLPVSKQFELTVITSLAIVRTLHIIGLKNTRIKWPNDIYAGNGKIAGILIENMVRANQLEWAILGIGLNVNQEVFKSSGATSIKLELAQMHQLEKVLELLLKSLNEYYTLLKSKKLKELREQYTRNLMWINESREFLDMRHHTRVNGEIIRVSPEGKLVVRTKGEEKVYDHKQIVFIG